MGKAAPRCDCRKPSTQVRTRPDLAPVDLARDCTEG
jgi:hypothetical protein